MPTEKEELVDMIANLIKHWIKTMQQECSEQEQKNEDEILSGMEVSRKTGIPVSTLLKWRRASLLTGYTGSHGRYCFKLSEVEQARKRISEKKRRSPPSEEEQGGDFLQSKLLDISKIKTKKWKRQ